MKVLLLFFIISFLFSNSYAQKDPVILTFDEEEVTKSEFLQVYLKNNNHPKYDKASLDDYMELYKKFKLKVAEAKHLGYDTLTDLKKELEGYRKQLARPYLTDSSKNKSLVEEAYERMKHEVEASHILIKVSPDVSPEDSLKAYNKIMAIKKRLDNGEDFESLAVEASEDPSAKTNKGYLGYFTAFQMVYAFESAAYNTKVGEVGGPVRTKFGYHLVKVLNKRPARGTIKTAHIMIAARRDADEIDVKNASEKIKEIYEKVQNGEDFHKLASLYSDDIGTRQKGGRLPAFGSGTNQRMVPEFEDASFALENDGDVSKPFRSDFGFHIVKRLIYVPLGSFDEMKVSLQNKVSKGSRGEKTQSFFVAKLKEQNKFSEKSRKYLENLSKSIDSSIYKGTWEGTSNEKNKALFNYAGNSFGQNDFNDYLVKNQRRIGEKSVPIFINEMYKKWQHEMIIADEESKLEEKYPEFKALMQEYRDGVLLYEVMKDKVWDKAIKDTTGLKAFYEKNKSNYIWPDRVQAEVYSSNELENVQATFELIQKQDTLNPQQIGTLINKDSKLNVSVEVEKFVVAETPYLKGRNLQEGLNEIVEVDGIHYLVRVKEILLSQPKSLKEARGSVIQDYQTYLEVTWLEELRERYTIKVHSDVLYSLEP